MKKKLFSILLSLCMAVTMMPAMTMTAFAAADTTLANFAGGNGEVATPYQIATKEQLDNLASIVNGGNPCADTYFKLTADIGDATTPFTTPIGNKNQPFKGNFDGAGHTVNLNITEANTYAGLFGCLNDGSIKNVTTAGTVNAKTKMGYTGPVAGVCASNIDGTIENCVNKAEVSCAGYGNGMGGICGKNEGGNISGCSNSAKIEAWGSSPKCFGGICGQNFTGNIFNCVNTGTVSTYTGNSLSLGGICGQNGGTSTQELRKMTKTAVIANCVSKGYVSVMAYGSGFCKEIGGVCGANRAGETYTSEIVNCFNGSSICGVEGTPNTQNLGGVVGYNYGLTEGNAVISNCYYDKTARHSTYGDTLATEAFTGHSSAVSNTSGMTSAQMKTAAGSTYTGEDSVADGKALVDLLNGYRDGEKYPDGWKEWEEKGDYPKFVKKVNVTLDPNDGSGTTTTNEIKVGSYGLDNDNYTAPTKEGYVLDGWYTAKTDGDKVLDAFGNCVAGVTGYTNAACEWINENNTTLYAHWAEEQTNVFVYVYGIEDQPLEGASVSFITDEQTSRTITGKATSENGFTTLSVPRNVSGHMEVEFSGYEKYTGETVTYTSETGNAYLYLEAKKPETVDISLDTTGNGAGQFNGITTSETGLTKITVEKGKYFENNENGYFYIADDATGTNPQVYQFAPNTGSKFVSFDPVKETYEKIIEGFTLSAKCIADEYDITYRDMGDKEFSGTHEDGHPEKHTYGEETALKSASKDKYRFLGWYTDAACTDGNKVTSLGANAYTDNITLYAKWEAISTTRATCRIYDKVSGDSIEGATVKFKVNHGKTFTGITKSNGTVVFEIPYLAEGHWEVTCNGYASVKSNDVQYKEDQVNESFGLEIGYNTISLKASVVGSGYFEGITTEEDKLSEVKVTDGKYFSNNENGYFYIADDATGTNVKVYRFVTNDGCKFSGFTPAVADYKQITRDFDLIALVQKLGLAINNNAPQESARDNHGYVSVAESADEGDTVAIGVYPNDGYELDTLFVEDEDSHNIRVMESHTFIMPGKAVTVSATFKKSTQPGPTPTPTPTPTPSDDSDDAKVVVSGDTATVDTADKTEADITVNKLKELVDNDKIEQVVIKTKVAEFTFDKKAITEIAGQTGDSTLIKVAAIWQEAESKKAALDVYELKVVAVSGNNEIIIGDFKDGKVTVRVAIPEGLLGKKLACLYKNDKGVYSRKTITKQDNEKGYFDFTTTHFSSYVVAEASVAQKLLVNQTSVTQNKLKANKGGKVKVSFKRATWDKELGKKVTTYQIYRATKKSGKYKKVATVTNKKSSKTITYTNKKLKKGKKYYYKVRGRVKLSNGKYAYTKWSKVKSVKAK